MLLVVKANFNGVPLFISEKNSTARLWVVSYASCGRSYLFIASDDYRSLCCMDDLHSRNCDREFSVDSLLFSTSHRWVHYIRRIFRETGASFTAHCNPSSCKHDLHLILSSHLISNRTDIITIVAAVFLLATFVLEGRRIRLNGSHSHCCLGWTLALFYKHWNIVYGNEERPFELNMPIRVLAFGLYVVIAMR